MRSDLVDVVVILVHQTEKAILVKDAEDSDPVWLPKSRIEVEPTKKANYVTVTMPEELAYEKGLV